MSTAHYTMTREPSSDWLLMQYAAGALPPYESMLVAAYLATSAAARHKYATFEAAGGRMIDNVEPVSVTHNCLNNILAVIEPAGEAATPHPAAPAAQKVASDCVLPTFMRRLLDTHCPQQNMNWQSISSGVAKIDIRLCHSEPRQRKLRLMRIAPDRQTPTHTHAGIEMTLVLEGSYHDGQARYLPGDLVIVTAEEAEHTPRAGADGCVCMILSEAPVRFHNPLLQALNLFWRI